MLYQNEMFLYWLILFELLVWEPYNKIKTSFFAIKLRELGSTFLEFSKNLIFEYCKNDNTKRNVQWFQFQ